MLAFRTLSESNLSDSHALRGPRKFLYLFFLSLHLGLFRFQQEIALPAALQQNVFSVEQILP